MQRVKKVIDQIVEAPQPALPAKQAVRPHVTPPAIQRAAQPSSSFITQDYLDYIKTAENRSRVGFEKGRWYPHKDPSGGWNVGYGHHLTDSEYQSISKYGLSNQEVENFLIQDLMAAHRKVHDYITKKYGVKLHLTPKQDQMLVDYVFNLGSLSSFPKMVDAIVRSDREKMGKEYKRSAVINGKRKEITGRNTQFANKFLSQAESLA